LNVILKGINYIRNQIKKSFFIAFICSFNFANAKIHEFETTHLKSLAGTGVAGIFMEEAAFLNPASLSYFNNGVIFFQRDSLTLKNNQGAITGEPKSTAIVFADGNPSVSGSLSYLTQEEGQHKRKRWGLSLSGPVNSQSSLGISTRKTKDENKTSGSILEYYQTVIGVTHAVDSQTSFGFVLYDAFRSKAKDTRAMIGAQHLLASVFTVNADLSADYRAEEISESLMYRGGMQFKVLDDFFIRFGAFNDKSRKEKGNGFGIGWVQPRLSFEFAIKNTSQKADALLGTTDSKIKETSLSGSIRF